MKAKACDKAEDPKYIEENNLKIDRLYYVEHQIIKPICGLLDFVIEDASKLFETHLRTLKLQRTKQNSIFSFMKRSLNNDTNILSVSEKKESDESKNVSHEQLTNSYSSMKSEKTIDMKDVHNFEDQMMNISQNIQIKTSKHRPAKKMKK